MGRIVAALARVQLHRGSDPKTVMQKRFYGTRKQHAVRTKRIA